MLGSIFFLGALVRYITSKSSHAPSNWRCHLTFLKVKFWKCVFFVWNAGKEKDSCISQWICPQLGWDSQRGCSPCGAWAPADWTVGTDTDTVWVSLETRGWFDEKGIQIFFLGKYLNVILYSIFFIIFFKKCALLYRYVTLRKINMPLKISLLAYTWALYTTL